MRESVVQSLLLTALHGPSNLHPFATPSCSGDEAQKHVTIVEIRYTIPSGDVPDVVGEVGCTERHTCVETHVAWGDRQGVVAIKSEDTRERALLELRKDVNAQSAGAPRDSLLKTRVHFHGAWFGHHALDDEGQPFPLTVMKNYAVGTMLKSGGYSELPEPSHHLWTDELSLAVRKTTSSITRGMGQGRQL